MTTPGTSPKPHGYDFTDRVAIITGGGSGIGAAAARLLAAYGADIVLAGRTRETLDDTAKEITEHTGRRCIGIPTDVRQEDQVINLVDKTLAEFGRIDILINNAGGARGRPLKDMTSKMWHSAFNLNIHAAFYCSHQVAPHFLSQGSGIIVNVSSLAGINGTKGVAPYAAAKCGLQMFTRVAAAEWGHKGIRVNCVAAGMIASEGALKNWQSANLDVEAGCANLPLRRPGEPEEVANAIVFLASDAASYITGETLAVSGGPQLGGFADE